MKIIVPPMLLVRMFGVPDRVAMPRKVGEEITFEAYSKRWHCKRISKTTWNLWAPLHSPRMRFGNASQIAEDIGHVLETGALPMAKESFC